MLLHLQDACKHIEGLAGLKVWADFLCVRQDDDDEKREEIAKSRHYYANAKECILCPWMGFGLSREDHRKSGERWKTRSWPVQEVVAAKKVLLIYNKSNDGSLSWGANAVTEEGISPEARTIYGDGFSEALEQLLGYRHEFYINETHKIHIEDALRMARSRTSFAPADLIYAYVGLSGIYQKLGSRGQSII